MKRLIIGKWLMGMGLIAIPFTGGCLQEAASSSATNSPGVTNVAVAPGLAESADVSTNAVMEVPAVDIADADYTPIQTEGPAPANVRTNGPVGEIIRMASSGVDQEVLAAFVTNSPAIFSLTADEVIYLNDIGVPGELVTTILHHDQVLRGNVPAIQPAPVEMAASQQAQMAQPQSAEAIAPQPVAPAPDAAGQPPPPADGTVQAAPAQAPGAQVNYNTFYNTLSPYGNWVYIQGYGQVWQPTIVVSNPSWEPYVYGGRWLYTDAGWYWASDYSWGWAPFHYGRWFRHYRLGWCWYPDYTWSPAWVSWRWTDGYCGWAALPPCAWYRPGFGLTYWGRHVSVGFSFGLGYSSFTFVSWNHFTHSHHYRHRVDHYHSRSIYAASHSYHRYEGNRWQARAGGPAVDRVSRAAGSPVHRVSLRDTASFNRGGRPERLATDGRTLTVYRPKMDSAATPARASLRGNDSASPVSRTSPRIASSLAERGNSLRQTTPAMVPSRAAAAPTKAPERPVSASSRLSRETLDNTRMARLEPVRTSATAAGSANARPNAAASLSQPSRMDRQTTAAARLQSQSPVAQQSAANTVPTRTPTSATAPQRTLSRTLPGTGSQPAPATRSTAQTQTINRQAQAAPTHNYTPAPSRGLQQPSSPRVQIAPSTTAPTPQRSYTAPTYTAPQRTISPAPAQIAPQRSTVQTPAYTAPQRSFNQAPYQSAPQRSYTAPTPPSYSPPQRSTAQSPSYSAPQRSFSPAPSQSAPQRSFSPPPSQSAPSRSYSAPTQSAPQRSFDSGSASRAGRGGDFGGRGR